MKEVAENTFESMSEDRRKVGRPRMRWLEDIQDDARELKVKNGGKMRIIQSQIIRK